MAEKISKNSWLKFSKMYNVDGVLFWDLPEFPAIEEQDDDQKHTIAIDDLGRIDLLAYDKYGDPELWWIILLANNKFSIDEFEVGEVITIPSPRYVTNEILPFARRK